MTPPIVIWHGAYDTSWKDLIVPQAFSHPAKASKALLDRIFDYLFEIGALAKGDAVVDPFGGIGTTAIIGASRGLRVVCCELEPKFVELARANVALHRPTWEAMDRPLPQIVQGDSRQLRQVLAAADGLVSSPPYEAIAAGAGGLNTTPGTAGQQSGRSSTSPSQQADQRYGDTAGQLSILPVGDIDALVSSPPYVSGGHHPDQTGAWNQNGRGLSAGTGFGKKEMAGYGTEAGQIGQMSEGSIDAVVASPAYATGCVREGSPCDDAAHVEGSAHSLVVPRPGIRTGSVDAVVSSPPFLDARSAATAHGSIKGSTPTAHDPEAMGTSDGNLQAMRAGDVDAIVSSPPFGFHAGGGGINTHGYRKDGTTGPSDDKVGDRTYQGTAADRTAGNLETLPFSPLADDVRALQADYNRVTSAIGETVAASQKGDDADKTHVRELPPLLQCADGLPALSGHGAGVDAARVSADAVVASPPYERSVHAGQDGIDWEKAKTGHDGGSQTPGQSVTAAMGQAVTQEIRRAVDHLEADGVLGSPPYENIERANHRPGAAAQRAREGRTDAAVSYGTEAGNMGNVSGETFWSAALQIVRESYAILKPGGYAVWIVKRFVRDRQVVDFPDDWRKLCEHVGFETTLEARAMLVQEEARPQLFGEPILSRRERKSFFRRLAEKKGSPRIDWETVLVMRKPSAGVVA